MLVACLLSAPLGAQDASHETPPARFRLSPSFGFAGPYNRVEGLPVRLGPVLERGGPSPFRVDAMLVWRTDMGDGLDSDAFGYSVEAQRRWGTTRVNFMGATAYSLVSRIEARQISELGASLSTFFLHRDILDYAARDGHSVFAGMDFPASGLTTRLTYADEEHGFLPAGTPLSVSGEARSWRPQPLVAVGSVRTLTAEVLFDDEDRARGLGGRWGLSARVTAAVGGSLALPAHMDVAPGPTDTVSAERAIEADFLMGFLDARRYFRLARFVSLRVRALAAGSLDGDPLPPQHQHALGGVGSLPGFHTFSADCGARARTYSVFHGQGTEATREPAFAGYGCDAVTLVQVEVEGRLPFGPGHDVYVPPDEDEEAWVPYIDLRPRWSLFLDAARGWSLSEPGGVEPLGPDTDVLVDMGVGLRVEDVGLYWAWPLGGSGGRGLLFLRLSRRF